MADDDAVLYFLSSDAGARLCADATRVSRYNEEFSVYGQNFASRGAAEVYLREWQTRFSPAHTYVVRPPGFQAKALFLDMDSTMIREESVDELAREVGCFAEVAAITQEAMEGRLDFAQAFQRRMQLLAGLSLGRMQEIAAGFTFHPGLPELVAWCQRQGIRVSVVSGGLLPMIKVVADKVGIEDIYGNNVLFTGKVISRKQELPQVNGRAKAAYVRQKCAAWGLTRDNVMAIGDGANDRYMLQEAAAAVGFQPHQVLYGLVNSVNNSGDHSLMRWLLEAKSPLWVSS
jgi:phosphoserine phosphatase